MRKMKSAERPKKKLFAVFFLFAITPVGVIVVVIVLYF
jgi:hypothetical protein